MKELQKAPLRAHLPLLLHHGNFSLATSTFLPEPHYRRVVRNNKTRFVNATSPTGANDATPQTQHSPTNLMSTQEKTTENRENKETEKKATRNRAKTQMFMHNKLTDNNTDMRTSHSDTMIKACSQICIQSYKKTKKTKTPGQTNPQTHDSKDMEAEKQGNTEMKNKEKRSFKRLKHTNTSPLQNLNSDNHFVFPKNTTNTATCEHTRWQTFTTHRKTVYMTPYVIVNITLHITLNRTLYNTWHITANVNFMHNTKHVKTLYIRHYT